jgi:ATP synthase subunit 6
MKINNILFKSPLDVFEISFINTSYLIPYFGPFTNFTLINIFILCIISFFLYYICIYKKIKLKSNPITLGYSLINTFLKNLLINATHSSQHIHYPLFLIITITLFITNLFGILPYGLSLTSHICLTFSLSFIFFIGFNIICVFKHKTNMVKLWLPHGTPNLIIPFIILIEILSYTTRVFSLSIRIFANMMAGHTLLKIISSFAWLLFISGGIMIYFSIFPLIIIFLILGLELAIAALQAYVFIVLISIYLGDALIIH